MPEMTGAVSGEEKLKEYFNTVTAANNVTVGPSRFCLEEAIDWYRDPTTDYASLLMGDLRGKTVLEIGCGIGVHLIEMARKGAEVTGVDVASERIKIAKGLVRDFGCGDRVILHAAGLFEAKLPSGGFDYIYGHDVLMYMKRDEKLMTELKRLLKPLGRVVFIEGLRDHPIARIYRKFFAPAVWNEFTDYFAFEDLDILRKDFNGVTHREFYMTGFLAYFWKTQVPCRSLFRFFDRILYGADIWILKAFPALKRYCWRIVFSAQKG